MSTGDRAYSSGLEDAGALPTLDEDEFFPDDVEGKKAGKGMRRKQRGPTRKLDMAEDELLAHLHQRGLISEAVGEAKAFRGGRPPLGMQTFRKVLELYQSGRIALPEWRGFFMEKSVPIEGADGAPNLCRHARMHACMHAERSLSICGAAACS